MTATARYTLRALLITQLLWAGSLVAQQPLREVIHLPALTLDGSRIDTTTTYDPSRHVYRYQYTVVAAATNKAPIEGFKVDVSGRTTYTQNDPDLVGTAEPLTMAPVQVQPASTLPVAVTAPLSQGRTFAGPNAGGKVAFGFDDWTIAAGQSVGGFVIECKYPPAIRKATLLPSDEVWRPIVASYRGWQAAGRDLVFSPNSTTQFSLPVDVIAPLDTDLAKLFDGGGQSSEVNDFLRYSQPTVNRLKVPAGTTSYNVIIFYGQTVNPATFAATLNGVDVTSKFHPFAGSAEVVNFPIGPGTTKLQLQAVGTKSSGATARDSDTLTFLQ